MELIPNALVLDPERIATESRAASPEFPSAKTGSLEPICFLAGNGSALPQRTEKPWGHEMLWIVSPRYAAKILHVEAGHRLSLQYHQWKEETLLVVRGRMALELESPQGEMERHEALPGQWFHILPGRKHRLQALETCDVLEVSTPELEDVVRIQDDYARA
jgi:quercetin dioxygenase-like cupin family protein